MAAAPLSIPNTVPVRVAPHRLGGHTTQEIVRAWTIAAGIVAMFGIVLFGVQALRLICIAVATGVVCDFLYSMVSNGRMIGGTAHSVLIGLLVALTLPVSAPWYVSMVGTMVAVLIAKGLFSGMGYYIWQPALVGRIAVQFIFSQTFAIVGLQTLWPVLAPGHLLVGKLGNAQAVSISWYGGFFGGAGKATTDAWLMPPPVGVLRAFADGKTPADGNLVYVPLLRDMLPPWQDTILGTVPGGIGETCTLGLVIAGLYLMYRGYLRWQLPVSILASAALAAAVLPVEWPVAKGGYDWLPGFAVENGRAVGLAYVLYHLTSGSLMLGAFLLAGDMISSPRRVRGQVAFGVGIGVVTIFMRLYGVLEGECYWAILIMNTMVPLIDRRSRRSVLGIAEPV
jgi:electron transport complex protein RnfD